MKKGIYFALLAAFISGLSIFFNKFAVAAIKPPLVFTTFKNLGVGLLIVSFILSTGKWKQIGRLSKKELIYLVLIGLIGGALPFYLFFTGLSHVPAINAAIIQKTLVVWVGLLAIPLLKEKLSWGQIGAIVLLFVSNFVIGGFERFQFSQGELFILLATILWAIENVIAKKVLPGVDPDIVVTARMGLGSLLLLGASFIVAPKALFTITSLAPMQYFWLSVSIIFLTAYVSFWYRALKHDGAITVTAILVSSTLVTNVLTSVFITHQWTATIHVQNILMLVGVGVFWYATKMKSEKELS